MKRLREPESENRNLVEIVAMLTLDNAGGGDLLVSTFIRNIAIKKIVSGMNALSGTEASWPE